MVPRQEVDQWQDLDPELASHLMLVAQRLGRALRSGFEVARVAVFIAGIEIPHAHLHLIPVETEVYRIGFDFVDKEEFRQREDADDTSVSPSLAEYEEAAEVIRGALRTLSMGHSP